MKIELDQDVQAVLEFMQAHVPTSKLLGVADKLPDMARLLWADYQRETFSAVRLSDEATQLSREPLPTAI